jgi:hypothetical protein
MDSTVSLELLGRHVTALQADMRALKRDMAMLRAQTAELPTVAQFMAGLADLDARVTELHAETNAEIRALAELIAKAI